jgi:hypothetical protein
MPASQLPNRRERCLDPIAMKPAFQEGVCLLDTRGHRREPSYQCLVDRQNEIIPGGWRFLACYNTFYVIARDDSTVLALGKKMGYLLLQLVFEGAQMYLEFIFSAQKGGD